MRRLIWPALLVAGLTLVACGGGGANAPGASSAPSASVTPAAAPDINTASITVAGTTKTVLTNTKGLTLYYFTSDSATSVACSGGCAKVWPPLLAMSDTATASPALPGKLIILDGANGKQILYNGHPLYTYSKDSVPGDANGQGLFGKWYVATPSLAAGAKAYNY